MSDTPSAVIFDMDGVLCRYHFRRRLERLSELTGVTPDFINEVIFEQGFDEEGDAGRYTADEYHRLFCERIGAPLTVEDWLDARAVSVEPDREVLDIARRLRGRVTLAMLTNNGPLLRENFPRVFPEAAAIFGEHAHFSCEFRACKPDPKVFLRLAEHLGIAPGAALFIDDKASYLEGAAQAGMLTHHFRSAAVLRTALAGHGLSV